MIEDVYIEVLSLDIRYFYINKLYNSFYGLYIFWVRYDRSRLWINRVSRHRLYSFH